MLLLSRQIQLVQLEHFGTSTGKVRSADLRCVLRGRSYTVQMSRKLACGARGPLQVGPFGPVSEPGHLELDLARGATGSFMGCLIVAFQTAPEWRNEPPMMLMMLSCRPIWACWLGLGLQVGFRCWLHSVLKPFCLRILLLEA